MAPTYSQSREFERVRIPTTAKISNPGRGVLSCPVCDLGLGGILLEADDCLRSGDICAMEICLDYNPDRPKLETYGRVVRLETGRGTAIEFTGMSPEAFDHLDRLMVLNRENGADLDEDLARKRRRGYEGDSRVAPRARSRVQLADNAPRRPGADPRRSLGSGS